MNGLLFPKRRPRPARRSGGHALVGTMGFLILAMFLWAAAFAHATGCLRTLKACQLRADGARPTQALAWGLALLESGVPPEDPYSCRVQTDGNAVFVVTFHQALPLHYTATVRPAVSADASLPPAPATFHP